jgi:hypothetical protein
MKNQKELSETQVQKDAREWLRLYQLSPNADFNHPAVQAMKELASTGELSNKQRPALNDLWLQLQALAMRSSGKSYEDTLELLSNHLPMSASTIGRRIKRKAMPSEIQELKGNDELLKFLFVLAQEKTTVKKSKN